jgi:hypothetical protein
LVLNSELGKVRNYSPRSAAPRRLAVTAAFFIIESVWILPDLLNLKRRHMAALSFATLIVGVPTDNTARDFLSWHPNCPSGRAMHRVNDFKEHAKACRALAARTTQPDDKVLLEEIAKAWDKIAFLRKRDLEEDDSRWRVSSSASLAIFAAIRRASSLVSLAAARRCGSSS